MPYHKRHSLFKQRALFTDALLWRRMAVETIAWIIQILLALLFAMAGILKMTQPIEKLKQRMTYVESLSPASTRVIGALELAGALGLILPMLTNILPWLTPLAALGLVLTMIGAALLHVIRKEYALIGINVVLLALAAFVLYARFNLLPLA